MAEELRDLIHSLRRERYLLASETLASAAEPLLKELSRPWDTDRSFAHFAGLLAGPNRALPAIRRQLSDFLTPSTRKQLEQVSSKSELFSRQEPDLVFYTAEDERGGSMLCASSADLTTQFRQTLWRQNKPTILASGTLAVGQALPALQRREPVCWRMAACVSSSRHAPFDYSRNCLLYLPHIPPNQGDKDYFDQLTDEILALLDVAHGHTLALFTSYAAMSAVKERRGERH